jgi:tRNA-dihydrouridine synthase
MLSFKGEGRAVREIKRHIQRYIRGMHGAAKLREVIFRLKTAGELRTLLQSLVSQPHITPNNGSCLN